MTSRASTDDQENIGVPTPTQELVDLFSAVSLKTMTTMDDKNLLEEQIKVLFADLTEMSNDTQQGVGRIEAKVLMRELENLESQWRDLKISVIKLNCTLKGRDRINDASFSTVKLTVRTIMKRLMEALEDPSENTKADKTVPPTIVQLPSIDLGTFDGKLAEWPNFQRTFKNVIDNNPNLTPIHKLHYLLGALRHEPLSIAQQFGMLPEAYQLAMNALEKRYTSVRLLASYYCKQLLNYKGSTATKFLENYRGAYSALTTLDIDLADYLLFEIAYEHLPQTSQRTFDLSLDAETIPSFLGLLEFVQRSARVEELKAFTIFTNTKATQEKRHTCDGIKRTLIAGKDRQLSCPVCAKDHRLFMCEVFKTKSNLERIKIVKDLNSCPNCLSHLASKPCFSRSQCRECGSKGHHTLLHVNRANVQTILPTDANQTTSSSNKFEGNTLCCRSKPNQAETGVLLGTVQLLIQDAWQNWIKVRGIVDPGSEINIITKSLLQKLNLSRTHLTCCVQGIGQNTAKGRGSASITIMSLHNKSECHKLSAVILDNICNALPTNEITVPLSDALQSLPLADPDFDKPAGVELLLGCEVYTQIIEAQIIKGRPTAVKTSFGWLLLGKINDYRIHNGQATSLITIADSLDETLTKFWIMEEVKKDIRNPQEELLEKQFIETHTRDNSGKYIVRLPLKDEASAIGANCHWTKECFLRLEKKLNCNPSLKEEYNNFMTDYLRQGHMNLATSKTNYVLPHHCVFKESSSTRLRVVFDASAKGNLGHSINDVQHTGTSYLRDIGDIILKFRLNRFAMTCDIKQMYRQIWLHPEDRQYQQIFWRPNVGDVVQQYELNTVTYGMTSSPYLAQRVLRQLAKDDGATSPAAVDIILLSSYMDDFAFGSDSIPDGQKMIKELVQLLQGGGFELRKWASNSSEMLKELPTEYKEEKKKSLLGEGTKLLGLFWTHESDAFCFKIEPYKVTSKITKRTVASTIAKIFDVLGFLAPVLFKAKVFLQKLWLVHSSWDEELPEDLRNSWLYFMKDFHLLSQLRIPRWIPVNAGDCRLLGFSDASEAGMAAVVFIHVEGETLSNSYLIRSKTKLAPLKAQTIPRLELSAALLLAELIDTLKPQLQKIQLVGTHLYTDSEIVLHWLKTPPHQLKTFVANRVARITELTQKQIWMHVSSENNAADGPSRGYSPSQLLEHFDVWNHGPIEFRKKYVHWPQSNYQPILDIPESKVEKQILSTILKQQTIPHVDRFSQYTHMLRVTAFMQRFIRGCRGQSLPDRKVLSISELENAEILCCKLVQHSFFAKEFKQIRTGRPLDKGLGALSPFIQDGLLRAGGRLQNALLSPAAMHPIIIPKGKLSSLICEYYHKKLLHAGAKTTLSIIQRKFWLISGMATLKSVIHYCQPCYKLKTTAIQPMMGQLPSCRVRPGRPFAICTVDMAGPIITKETTKRKGTQYKSYLCAFVCMTTKAVHLELVSDLSTSAFIASLQRFTARRSTPTDIYSDNGKNFVGAAIKVNQFNSQTIEEYAIQNNINWHFLPPYAPNFNGLCEAVVKSAKGLIIRQIGTQVLTFEELTTLLTRVEAVLNSRPLVETLDPSEANFYLTPAHFLVGDNIIAPNVGECSTDSIRQRWATVQKLQFQFWKVWRDFYLNSLLPRKKWQCNKDGLKIGQIIYIKENTPPLVWPLGVVEAVHPGQDGIVRVASIRTKKGIIRRAVSKLIPLPMQQ